MSAVRIETWEPVNFSREREHNRRDAGGDGRTAGRWENVPNFTETRVRFFPATVRTQHMHFRNVSTYCTQLKDLSGVVAEISDCRDHRHLLSRPSVPCPSVVCLIARYRSIISVLWVGPVSFL